MVALAGGTVGVTRVAAGGGAGNGVMVKAAVRAGPVTRSVMNP